MRAIATKRPDPDFIVRLVGPGVRPWGVPMRALTKALVAVQRIVEQKEEDEHDTNEDQAVQVDAARILHLMGVKSSSAAYAVAAPRRANAVALLKALGRSIEGPADAEWSMPTLSSIEDLSEVANALGCEIEFRKVEKQKRFGEVLAKITPRTYGAISSSAYIRGTTSIYARIERVGGATAMHCGIRLPDSPRKMIICRVATRDLVRELGQYMYQYLILSGRATWLRHRWKLTNIVIDSFEPPKNGSVLETLRGAHDAGGYAWDEIPDPDSYLSEMRRP